jgi:hypothetical protein
MGSLIQKKIYENLDYFRFSTKDLIKALVKPKKYRILPKVAWNNSTHI